MGRSWFIVIVGVGLAAGGFVGFQLGRSCSRGESFLAADAWHYDFGTVQGGTRLDHKFVFKNTGEGLLQIRAVDPCCGLKAELIGARVLRPGERGELRVSVDTTGRRGKVDWQAIVHTNALTPRGTEPRFVITATVVQPVAVSPVRVDLGIVRRDRLPDMRSIFLRSGGDGAPIELLDVVCTAPGIVVAALEIEKGSLYRIDVAIPADAPVGVLEAEVMILVGGARPEQVAVPVRGEVVGLIRVVPPCFFFGVVQRGVVLTREVELTCLAEGTTLVKCLSHDLADVVSTSFVETPGGHRLRAILNPDRMSGDIRGAITVETTNPKEQYVRIPVLAFLCRQRDDTIPK